MADFDLAIIGGGINGTGIARDAAGRGLSVLLIEQNDLASGTSSKSTKLIHGGLRYLEVLCVPAGARGADRARGADPARAAPDPAAALRAAASFRAAPGLDAAARAVPLRPSRRARDPARHRLVDLSHHAVGEPLKREFRQAFVYSDGWVDDARLVVLNAVDAAERGAVVRTRTRLTAPIASATLAAGAEHARAPRGRDRGRAGQRSRPLGTRGRGPPAAAAAVGACPPDQGQPHRGAAPVRARHAYAFQNADNRIVFAIPYEGDFTLIGTT
jgi:glycerol-3-phosphate dehydrogenase